MCHLIGAERGNLVSGEIQSLNFEQSWGLDGLGNWATFNEDQGGNGFELQQTRDVNTANEITAIGATAGSNWADPVYDAVGNMTTLPKPANPTSTFTCKFDAWNRLTEVKDGQTVVVSYSYDGLNRRATRSASGTTRHYYYTTAGQVVEERVGTSSTADRQYVWGIRYVDDLILRDRDTDANGSLDERLYVFQDANWNVTALVDASGTVVERYAYDPYGKSLKLNPDFTDKTSGTDYQWTYRYTTQELDPDTGVIYYGARYYDPNSGTWIGRDPAQSDPNLYRYVRNNPLNRTDPTGMEESGGSGGSGGPGDPTFDPTIGDYGAYQVTNMVWLSPRLWQNSPRRDDISVHGPLIFYSGPPPTADDLSVHLIFGKADLNTYWSGDLSDYVLVPTDFRGSSMLYVPPPAGGWERGDTPDMLRGNWVVYLCASEGLKNHRGYWGHTWILYVKADGPDKGKMHTMSKASDDYGTNHNRDVGYDWTTRTNACLVTDPRIYYGAGFSGTSDNCVRYSCDVWEKYTGQRFVAVKPSTLVYLI